MKPKSPNEVMRAVTRAKKKKKIDSSRDIIYCFQEALQELGYGMDDETLNMAARMEPLLEIYGQ